MSLVQVDKTLGLQLSLLAWSYSVPMSSAEHLAGSLVTFGSYVFDQTHFI